MFRDEKDEFNTNDYDILQILGYGAFGRVYKAKCRRSGRVVALKRIDLKTRARTTPLAVLREISTLRNVEHENIIALMDVSFANTSLILVMEYVRTNLSAAIKDATRPRTFGVVKFFFKQIFAALAYLHANDIMHRDLKPENILLNAQNRVKLADFGQARLHLPNRTYEHEVGTRWYRAPELLFGATVYTPNVDIWSAGCVLAEFLNEKPLFSGSTDLEQLSQIFAVLGTPNKDNWPEWSQLPDATKITFKPRHPTPKLTDLSKA